MGLTPAQKAARTRKRRKKGYAEVKAKGIELGKRWHKATRRRSAARKAAAKRPKSKKKKKKMPANVVKYFKLLGQGVPKTEARKQAGLPPKGKSGKKKWGPGHPLYDWQQKQK